MTNAEAAAVLAAMIASKAHVVGIIRARLQDAFQRPPLLVDLEAQLAALELARTVLLPAGEKVAAPAAG